ncbi:hypothetical protein V496_01751 [Pseudogymnoascus sp. VKM F-4515 (FW-2607)]|nr:hypothetical protein V496_01751 [Pseudogymnoascus sp. VKM F-4515 (FW-2607)]
MIFMSLRCYGISNINRPYRPIPGETTSFGSSTTFAMMKEQGTNVHLVFPVLGHHLGFQTAKFEQGGIPVAVIKEVARQLLQELEFLHQECSIIHTDLTPSNILLELDDTEVVVSRSGEFFGGEGNLLRIPKLSPASLLSLMDGENEVLQRTKDMPEAEVSVFVYSLE